MFVYTHKHIHTLYIVIFSKKKVLLKVSFMFQNEQCFVTKGNYITNVMIPELCIACFQASCVQIIVED